MKPRNPFHSRAARSSKQLCLCSIAFTLLTAAQSMAQLTWTGAAGTAWNDSGNWLDTATLLVPGIPAASTVLNFGGATYGAPANQPTNNDIAGLTTGAINFISNGVVPGQNTPITLGAADLSQSITLGGNITTSISGSAPANAGFTDIINLNLALPDASRVITVNNNGTRSHNLNILGLISEASPGPFGLTKSGPAVLGLGNTANTFAGDMTITGGIVTVTSLQPSGAASSIGQGTAINLGGTLAYNTVGAVSVVAPAGAINRTINLTGNGGISIEPATHSFTFNGTFNNVGASAKTFTLGGNAGSHLFQSNLVDNGVLNFAKGSNNTWTLTGANTYTGYTHILGGTLSVSKIADSGDSNIGYGTELRMGNFNTAATLNYTGSGNTTVRTLLIGTTDSTNNNAGATINQNGANGGNGLVFSAPNLIVAQAQAATARTLTLGGSNTDANEISGIIANVDTDLVSPTTTALTKAGAGRWILSAANTYTGVTTVTGGSLHLNHANALPAGGALTLNGGVIGLGVGNFTRSLGALGGEVQITGTNSGFAAYGADRIVNLGGASASVSFGAGSFFTAGTTLVLGATTATHTVDFQNPIALSGTRFFRADDGPAAVDGRLSGAITGATTFSKAGNGTLEITNSGNAWTNTTFIDSGTLRLGAADVLPSTTVVVKRGTAAGNTSGVLDLNGFSETIGPLTLGESANDTNLPAQTPSVVNSSITPATLTLGGDLNYESGSANQNGQAAISAKLATGTLGNRNIIVENGSATEDLLISGELSGGTITKLGAGTLVLSNPANSGNTTVSDGTLVIRKVGVQTNANPNNDASTITIAAGKILNLDYSGTDKVTSLIINGVTQANNAVYNSTNTSGYITGTGSITVGTPPSDPYLVWAGPGVDFDADANNDGVDNGLAWLLGASGPNVSALGKLPAVTETGSGLKLTFDMLPSAARGGSQLFIEHSGDIGVGDPWTSVLVPDANGGTAPVTFIVNDSDLGNPSNPLDVEAMISNSEALNSKLFGRLKAVR